MSPRCFILASLTTVAYITLAACFVIEVFFGALFVVCLLLIPFTGPFAVVFAILCFILLGVMFAFFILDVLPVGGITWGLSEVYGYFCE